MSTQSDDMPIDPQELMKTFASYESGQIGDAPFESNAEETNASNNDDGKEKAADVKDEGKQEAKQDDKQADNDQANTQEDDPEGVATKDGKNIIPYSVLRSERDKSARAQQLLLDSQNRVAELEAQLQNANNPGTKTGDTTRANDQIQPDDELSEEDLAQLKEDFPTVHKALMAQKAMTAQLESKLAPVEKSVNDIQQDRENSTAEDVQAAIDSVPKLAHIQATDNEAFDLAKQFDATLKVRPNWADRPLAERFAKVVEMVESSLGITIEIPAAKSKTDSMSADEIANAARAKAESTAKASKSGVPNSLSDFPAGHAVAENEGSAVEQMNHAQLSEKLWRMTPEEQQKFYASL